MTLPKATPLSPPTGKRSLPTRGGGGLWTSPVGGLGGGVRRFDPCVNMSDGLVIKAWPQLEMLAKHINK